MATPSPLKGLLCDLLGLKHAAAEAAEVPAEDAPNGTADVGVEQPRECAEGSTPEPTAESDISSSDGVDVQYADRLQCIQQRVSVNNEVSHELGSCCACPGHHFVYTCHTNTRVHGSE